MYENRHVPVRRVPRPADTATATQAHPVPAPEGSAADLPEVKAVAARTSLCHRGARWARLAAVIAWSC